jgi:VIT1/CCC1 family predicted Fe2+/Mn2+ transporter
MKTSIKMGMGFGLTSGIITTLGLVIGLYSSTKSLLAIIGAIVIIAVTDSLSDSFGMHVAEESDRKETNKKIWETTFSTLVFKFFISISFIVPFLIFMLARAVFVCAIWGLALIMGFSFYIARKKDGPYYKSVGEHLIITLFVIAVSYFLGELVRGLF